VKGYLNKLIPSSRVVDRIENLILSGISIERLQGFIRNTSESARRVRREEGDIESGHQFISPGVRRELPREDSSGGKCQSLLEWKAERVRKAQRRCRIQPSKVPGESWAKVNLHLLRCHHRLTNNNNNNNHNNNNNNLRFHPLHITLIILKRFRTIKSSSHFSWRWAFRKRKANTRSKKQTTTLLAR